MTVDVTVETLINRPVAEVAAYAGDPANAPEWYSNIRSVRWLSEPPVGVGSRMEFVAGFLGRTLAYIYEVTDLVPNKKLVMQTAEGPFPMRTTYAWEPSGAGTRMILRNDGSPSGFAKVAAPAMAAVMRRATKKDLAKLKRILESRAI